MRTEMPGSDELVYADDVHFIAASWTNVDLKKKWRKSLESRS